MKRNLLVLFINLLFFLLTSCENNHPQYYEMQEYVIDKDRKEKVNSTVFRIAFSSGYDTEVSYGLYSKLKIGDTVTIRYYNAGFQKILTD